jgi:hypothetical protein
MNNLVKNLFFIVSLTLATGSLLAQSKLPPCQGEDVSKWTNCLGVADYESGVTYVGKFKKGQRSGSGISSTSDGPSYDGQWSNGKFNGQGTFIFSDGVKYVGQWKNGEYDGQGTLTYPEGSYTGQWKNGKRNG